MIQSLVTDADLARRLAAREAREGERGRARCKRRSCRKAIPPGKRADAVWCSERCRRDGRREERDRLVRDVRRQVRALAPAACACGAALDTGLRPGPVPRQCPRCYQRDYMRRYRAAARQDAG